MGSGHSPKADQKDGKLIELARGGGDIEAGLPLSGQSSQDGDDDDDDLPMQDASEDLPPDIASVITQVNSTSQPMLSPSSLSHQQQLQSSSSFSHPNAKPSWRDRFRTLFCCFSPSSMAIDPNDNNINNTSSSSGGGGTTTLPPTFYLHQHDDCPPIIRPYAPTPPPRLVEWEQPILGPPSPRHSDKVCLVLDLDETLVHSSFRPIPSPDFIIPVEIEGRIVDVYVIKRPFVDHFMRAVGQRFEVVVFTASLGKYADPLLDLLDQHQVVKWRLFRESCVPWEGSYVKDLTALGRDLSKVVIVDNSPHSYVFQPENALPIGTFIDDPDDQELLECLEVLMGMAESEDVRENLAPVMARQARFYYG
jgi:carboxy-terminal domain RNA polymerase II polypeptide A small phosphatase